MMKMINIKTKLKVKNTNIIALFLSMILIFAVAVPLIAAQGTPTPNEWRKLLTETPDGAYRPISGVTLFPQRTSPSGTESKDAYSAGSSPATNHTLWRADIPVYEWNKVLADRGQIFLGSTLDHCYYSLDQNTGEVIWAKDLIGGSQRWPQLAFNLVFVRDNRYTVALSQNNGYEFWRSDASASPALSVAWPQVFEDGDAVYLSHSRSNITALKVTHEEYPSIDVMWNRDTIRGRLSYSDGLLIGVGSYSTWVTAVDAATGDLVWNFTGTGDPADMFYPSPTIADGYVYLGTENNGSVEYSDHIVCLDAKTGEYQWTFKTGEYFVETISAAYGKIYVAGGEQNHVYCIDGTTGEEVWTYTAPGFIDYYNIQVGDGRIYFVCAAVEVSGFPVPGTFPGLTNCVDAYTGELIWSYATETSGTTTSLIDGKLYHQTEEDWLWCFGKGPTTTVTDVTSQSLVLDQTTTLYGTVEDMSPFSQQHPEIQYPWVRNAPIVLSYVKDGGWHDFATVTTNDFGEYQYEWTPTSEGVYTVTARFEGDDSFFWSSDKTTVQVSLAPPTPTPTPQPMTDTYLGITTIVLVAAIGIAVFLLLRKK